MTRTGGMLRQFLVLLYLGSQYAFGGEEKCERKSGVIKRHCLKQCIGNNDCVSPRKRCLCDGDCGRSCINRNLRCKGLHIKIANGRANVLPYNQFGAVAQYSCHDGYRLYGESARVCQGNEKWSGKEPKCVLDKTDDQSECKEPPVVHNARHDGGNRLTYEVGSQLHYKCNEGFIPSPEKAIETAWCVGGSGLWVGPKMQCAHAGCPLLPPIDFGTVEIVPPNMIGSLARYSCQNNYHLAGRAVRKCLHTGVWEGVEPSCEQVKCGEPPTIENASHSGVKDQNYMSGQQLIYICNFGFTAHENNQISQYPPRTMCSSSGKWTSTTITCQAVDCGNPGTISHGRRDGFTFRYPAVVSYRCDIGYDLVGRATRRCQPNGSWSGSIPNCKPAVCPPISAGEHGYMKGTGSTYKSIRTFSCEENYKLIGTAVRTCMAEGRWFGRDAVCQKIDCGKLPPLDKGYYDGHGTSVGSNIKFRCDPETTYEGKVFFTVCEKSGKWSHLPPKCWGQCKVPWIENGTVIGGQEGVMVDHNTALAYRCDRGLGLDSPGPVVCNNGDWSHLPSCMPSGCLSVPPPLDNGRRIFLGSRHQDKAKYICLPGYKREGDKFLICQYGRWKGVKPYCRQINCPNPGKLHQGYIFKQGTIGKFPFSSYIETIRHGTRLIYECKPGHELVGPNGATCVDGRWQPSDKPGCEPTQHMVYQPRWHRFRYFHT